MAQKKQVSRLKDLKKSKKCSQYQMYDSKLKKCVKVLGRSPFDIPPKNIYDKKLNKKLMRLKKDK